jgi:hypothetical protein
MVKSGIVPLSKMVFDFRFPIHISHNNSPIAQK